jgi:hypothetical protein
MFSTRTIAFAALICIAFPLVAHAQSASSSSAKPAAKSLKKITPVSQLAPVRELTPEQLELANRIALGKMPCELSAFVHVKLDPSGPGRFILETGKRKFYMVPVVSLTGALRLEDEAAGAVWIQLGNKSMLMDQKAGRRLADACVSADQAIVAKELERNPAPSLLDVPAVIQAGNESNSGVNAKVASTVEPANK